MSGQPTVEVECSGKDGLGETRESVEAAPGALALRLLRLLVEHGVVTVNLLNRFIDISAPDAGMLVYGDFDGDRWQEAVRLLGIPPEHIHDERL